MREFTLVVNRRDNTGSSSSRRLRRKGFVPGIVYSDGSEGIPVVLKKNEFIKLARKAFLSQLFTFKSDDPELDGKIAIVREIQKDYLNGSEPIHVDLLALKKGVEVTVDVPLIIEGEAVGVKVGGGILSVSAHELSVTCLPEKIPEGLKVDVSGVDIGQSIQAKDIGLPEGVTLAGNPDETVVSVLASRMAVEEETPEEGEQAEEGAQAAGEGEEQKEKENKEEKEGKE